MRLDSISLFLIAGSILIPLYLFTFKIETDIILFPTILLLGGMGLSYYFNLKREYDPDITEEETKQILSYTIIGLAGLIVLTYISPRILTPQMAMSLTQATMFTVLLAVSEEVFFRGALQTYFTSKFPSFLGIVAASAIFTLYHLYVYGSQLSSLFYVFAAGLILGWTGYVTDRLSTPMLIHIVNNLLSVWR